MATFERKLKVSKTDAFEVNVSSWANGEALSIDGITDSTGLTSVVSSTVSGGIISVLLTGIGVGTAKIHFEYSTPTRSNCYVATLNVIEGC